MSKSKEPKQYLRTRIQQPYHESKTNSIFSTIRPQNYSMSAKVIILEFICPILGVITGNLMCASPFKDLTKAVRYGDLGDLNPTPWAFMLGDCLGWTAYGIMSKDPWLFFGNCPGLLMSVWYNLGAVKVSYLQQHSRKMRENVVQMLMKEDQIGAIVLSPLNNAAFEESDDEDDEEDEELGDSTRTASTVKSENEWDQLIFKATSRKHAVPDPHANLIMAILFIWISCISGLFLIPGISQSTRGIILPSFTTVNLILFYGAPLSTIFTVIRLRDSSSIHFPTMAMNTLNGAFWTAYGFAISDFFILVPNAMGTVFGIIQFLLYFMFPSHRRELINNFELAKGKGTRVG